MSTDISIKTIKTDDGRFIYTGELSHINFKVNKKNELEASITIKTMNYSLTSPKFSQEFYDFYTKLLTDATIMQTLEDRKAKKKEDIISLIDGVWKKCWLFDKDPFSSLVGITKSGELICHAALMHGDHPGEAELICIVAKEFQRMRVGTTVCELLVTDYAQALLRTDYFLKGKPLRRIFCAVAPDHIAAEKIVKKIGMQYTEERERFGHTYHIYSMNIAPPASTGRQCVIL